MNRLWARYILFNTHPHWPISIQNSKSCHYQEDTHMKKKLAAPVITSRIALGVALLGSVISQSALAGAAVGIRAGTFGFGPEVDVGLTETLNVRVGYNTLSYNRTIEDTDITYDGKLKIGAASAIFDWHAFHGGFRFSLGAVQKGPKVDVVGKPNANGTFEIDGVQYTAAQIGSATGTIKMGDSVAPYIGIGWGNTVDKEDRVTFLFDLGAIHTGSPKVDLNFTCNASLASASGDPTCSQFNSRIAAEKADLEDKASDYEWYPVISFGIAVRF
jgi:hypothetical protein